MNAWQSYLEKSRSEAFEKASKAALEEVRQRRAMEKDLRRRGTAPTFSDLNLSDINAMEKDGRFSQYIKIKEFQERYEQLVQEEADAIRSVQEAVDHAVMMATIAAPPEVQIARQQQGEREVFLAKHGITDPDQSSPWVKENYGRLVKAQENEIKNLESARS